jgi:hypothetical protein
MTIDLTRDDDRQCRECAGTGLMNMGPAVRGGADQYQRCDCTPAPDESDYACAIRLATEANLHMDENPHVPLYMTRDEWQNEIREKHNDED